MRRMIPSVPMDAVMTCDAVQTHRQNLATVASSPPTSHRTFLLVACSVGFDLAHSNVNLEESDQTRVLSLDSACPDEQDLQLLRSLSVPFLLAVGSVGVQGVRICFIPKNKVDLES